jgi:hypothetical protein
VSFRYITDDDGITVAIGEGKSEYGPGVRITMDGNAVARAIDHWLHAKGIYITGARTITLDGELLLDRDASVYVDPSGFVMAGGKRFNGRGEIID